jgi:hypothetical protein
VTTSPFLDSNKKYIRMESSPPNNSQWIEKVAQISKVLIYRALDIDLTYLGGFM